MGEHFRESDFLEESILGRAIFFRDRTSVSALILRNEQHFLKGKGLDATVTKNGVYNMRSMGT